MPCPRSYVDELSARLAGEKIERISKGRQEPKPYKCKRCKKWHLEESK